MTVRFDAVLLDADGTLFDFARAEAEAFARAMAAAGLPHGEAELARYRVINEGLWRALERGELSQERLKAERFGLLFAELDLPGDGEAMNRAYLDELAEGWFLLPGALELCRTLSGVCRLFVATNGIGYVQRRRLEASPLRPYIEDIFISGELDAAKPDPVYFDRLLARIPGCPPRERILILGDSLSSDMRGGRAAGLATCWFNPSGAACSGPELCDRQIARLEDLIGVVAGDCCGAAEQTGERVM